MDTASLELLKRFVERKDPTAFEEVVRRFGPMVMGICRRELHDEQEAEDAFQATFWLLARKADTLRKKEALASWLWGVAAQVSREARRRSAKLKMHEQQAAAAKNSERWEDGEGRQELGQTLNHELQRLPVRYQQPVVLCYLEGRSVDEAAVALGWPRGTVAGRLARARALLRERLERHGFAIPVAGVEPLLRAGSPAGLPPELVSAVVDGAARLVSSSAPASGSAAALMEGVQRAMFFTQLKLATGLVLLGLSGLGWGYWTWAGEPRVAAPPASPPAGEARAVVKKPVDLSAPVDMEAFGLRAPLIPLLEYLAEQQGFELTIEKNTRELLRHLGTLDYAGSSAYFPEPVLSLGEFLDYVESVSGLRRKIVDGKLLLDAVSLEEVLERRRPSEYILHRWERWPGNLSPLSASRYSAREIEEGKLEDPVLERFLALWAHGVGLVHEPPPENQPAKPGRHRAVPGIDFAKLLERNPPLSDRARAAVLLLVQGRTLDLLKADLEAGSALVAEAAALAASALSEAGDPQPVVAALRKSAHPRVRAIGLAPWVKTFKEGDGPTQHKDFLTEAEMHLRSDDSARKQLALSAVWPLSWTLKKAPSEGLAAQVKALLKDPDPRVRILARQYHLATARYGRVSPAFAFEAMRDEDPENQLWGVQNFWQDRSATGTRELAGLWEKAGPRLRLAILHKKGGNSMSALAEERKPYDGEEVILLQELNLKAQRDPCLAIRQEAPYGPLLRDALLHPHAKIRSNAEASLVQLGVMGVGTKAKINEAERDREFRNWIETCLGGTAEEARLTRRFLARLMGAGVSTSMAQYGKDRFGFFEAFGKAFRARESEFSKHPENRVLLAFAQGLQEKKFPAGLEAILLDKDLETADLGFYFLTGAHSLPSPVAGLLCNYLIQRRDPGYWATALQVLGTIPADQALAVARDPACPPKTRVLAIQRLQAALETRSEVLAVLEGLSQEKEAHPAIAFEAAVAFRQLAPRKAQPGETPVAEVMQWPEFQKAAVVDPYAGRPKLAPQEKEALRARMRAALPKYMGEISKWEESSTQPAAWAKGVVLQPRWTVQASWTFSAARGRGTVWTGAGGLLQAELEADDPHLESGKELTDWVRTFLEDLWGGKLEAQPDRVSGNEGNGDFFNQVTCAWDVGPPTRNAYAEETVSIFIYRKREELYTDQRKRTGRIVQKGPTQIALSCAVSPQKYKDLAVSKPAKMLELEALSRAAWAVLKEGLKDSMGKSIRDLEDLRVVQAKIQGDNSWSIALTAKWMDTRSDTNPHQRKDGVKQISVSVEPLSGRVSAVGEGMIYPDSAEEYRRSGHWNRSFSLKEVEGWPEFAAIPAQNSHKIEEAKKRTGKFEEKFAKVWPAAKEQCARAVRLLRPEQAALLEKVSPMVDTRNPQIGDKTLRLEDLAKFPDLKPTTDPEKYFAASLGQYGKLPELYFQFAVETGVPRLSHLRLYLPATGKEPPLAERAAWETIAAEDLEKVYGRKTAGAPKVYPEPGSRPAPGGKGGEGPSELTLSWAPKWKELILAADYGLTFQAVKTAEGFMLSLTGRRTENQVAKALAALDAYPLAVDRRKAIAVVVKNMAVLAPEAKVERAVVKEAELHLEETGLLDSNTQYAGYRSVLAIKRLAGMGPLVPLWQVNIDLNQPDRRSLSAWVDPATGELVRFEFAARPVETKCGG